MSRFRSLILAATIGLLAGVATPAHGAEPARVLAFTPGVMLAQASPAPTPDDPVAVAEELLAAAQSSDHRGLAVALALVLVVLLVRTYGVSAADAVGLAKVAAVLGSDRGGAVLVLLLSLAGAVATALAAGKMSGAVLVTALGVGFKAAGGFVVVKRILAPKVPAPEPAK